MNNPTVSIGIITCNQAQFLKRCIESVLEQEISFSCELIICDDASDDNSESIVSEYFNNSKMPLSYIKNTIRLGPLMNGKNFWENAKGKYLCWLDADDYWCFKKKLENQINFLNINADYNGCFHDAKIISDILLTEKTSSQLKVQTHAYWKYYSQFNKYTPDYYPWDALQRKIIPTASLIFRNNIKKEFFELFRENNLSVSWALHLEIIKNSKFKYFNEVWSVYTDHEKGFSKSIDLLTFKLNNINILLKILNDEYYNSIKKDVFKSIANEYFHLLYCNEARQTGKRQFNYWCKEYKFWTKKALKAELTTLYKEFKNHKEIDSCVELSVK